MSNVVVLTPSAVNKYLKTIIEGDRFLKYFVISGEISNFKRHSSGTLYFSIKDNEATISCSMWSSNAHGLAFNPKDGDLVEITASIFLNVKSGYYSLNVSKMKLDGEGDLYQKFLQLKTMLEQKGYFSQTHKQSINKFPHTIGLITSPTSAAVKDMITTIKRRYPVAKIIIIPTLVQGKAASRDIAKNIKRANEMQCFDVLIVGRGGGSIEDLWAFNEEIVAEATFNSQVPIISSVGHETDTTIIDYVADLRAPTPTAAAEMATPSSNDLNREVNTFVKTIGEIITQKTKVKHLELTNLINNQYFTNPLFKKTIDFDNLCTRLIKETNNLNLELANNLNQINTLSQNSEITIKKKVDKLNNNLEHSIATLNELNPLTILSRGYSYVESDLKVIKSIDEVELNQALEIKLNDGIIKAKVTGKEIYE